MEFKLFVLELLCMKLPQKKIIAKIKSYFKSKKEVIAIYLYGSYARNEQKKDSDIDLAVLFNEKTDNRLSLRFKYESDLSHLLDLEVEIQELNNIGIELGKRIIDEGTKIFTKSPQMDNIFKERLISKYFDMLPFYTEYYYNLEKRALEGKFNDRY